MRKYIILAFISSLTLTAASSFAQQVGCDKACLQNLADQYRAAYLAHDPSQVAIAPGVRFSENFVEMPFPDASWDTVTKELGATLTLTDPQTSQIGIYTAIMQNDTPGFLAVRLKVENFAITEIEHVISTRRNLSSPPTPIGDHETYIHDSEITRIIALENRQSRDEVISHSYGYFSTLQHNDGEIRGTCFASEAIRRENGLLFTDIEGGFKSGRYLFNNEVRNWPVLVDEELGVVMSRGFIDHKGVLDEYQLTDGTPQRSVFREPQTWGFLEMFKVRDNCIASVVANFVQSPYKMDSPWNPRP